MAYSNRDSRSGGGRKFGGRGGFGGNRGGHTEMHHATCSNCGKDCEVPFRPTGEKPVYCRECFNKNGGNDSKKSYGRDGGRFNDRRPSYEKPAPRLDNEQLKSINNKLDQIIKLLTPKAPKESNDPKAPKIKKEKTPVLLAETTPVTEEKPTEEIV